MQQLGELVHTLILHLGYAGIFIVMALANIGIPLGTELVVPTAGALAGTGHLHPLLGIPAWIVVAIVATAGEVLGGFVLYNIGWYGGLPFVRRYGRYVHFHEDQLGRIHAFYEKWGKPTVFWCRFIPVVRGVAALPPGISRMQKRYFVTYTALGSAVFCFALAYLGEVAGRNLDSMLALIHSGGLAVLGIAVVIAVGAFVWWRARSRRARAASLSATTPPR